MGFRNEKCLEFVIGQYQKYTPPITLFYEEFTKFKLIIIYL